MPEDKQRLMFCSFPQRHGDVSAAKRTRFCSFPRRHGINDAKKDAQNDAMTNWRRTRVQPPDPQIINGNPSLRIREKNEKTRRRREPVLLCTTKFAQSTSQYYCVLQSLDKSFSVLLRTTKLAQCRSQYYCVLQSLHKHVPSTTVYYKACTKSFPVLLCTTKLAHTR